MLKHLSVPSILIGHSLGGTAVLVNAGQVPEVKVVATISAPADPAHLVHNFESSRAKNENQGEAIVKLVGRPFCNQKQILEDI
jgi:enterochelin esterase-like enzyme